MFLNVQETENMTLWNVFYFLSRDPYEDVAYGSREFAQGCTSFL